MPEQHAVARERAMQRRIVAAVGRQGLGSVPTAASVANPTITSVQKIARHDHSFRIRPPALGPTSGAIAITVISVDIMRAARSPSYRSRTMARANTTLAQAPRPAPPAMR